MALHGREPASLRECPAHLRAAWDRRLALRAEFPGRPWDKGEGQAGSASAQGRALVVPSAARAAPSAASNLSCAS